MSPFALGLLMTVGLSSSVFGKDPSSTLMDQRILDPVRQAVKGIETLSGDFIEEKRLVMLKEPAILTGRFFYGKPDRLRWEYLTPERRGFSVSNSKGLQWQHNPSRTQPLDLEKDPVFRSFVRRIFAWIRADFETIQKEYEIRLVSENPLSLALIPLLEMEKTFIDRVILSFSKDMKTVRSVDIHETDGDASRIRFSDIRINPPLNSGMFP